MQLTSLNLGAWKATADDNEIRLQMDGLTIAIPKENVNDLIALLMMTNPGPQPEFVTMQEAGDRLGKSRTAMRRATDTDRIPGLSKAGDTTIILAASLDHIEAGKPGNPAWLKSED